MKRVLKYTMRTVGIVLIVFLLFLGSLFFREQRLPRFVVDRIENRLSTDEMRVRIKAVSFGFRHGLRLQGVRAYDLRQEDSLGNPICVAKAVTYDYRRQEIEVVGANFLRIPESHGETAGWVEPEIPDLPTLKVTLDHPVILGLAPDRVEARLEVGDRKIVLRDLDVSMVDRDQVLSVRGGLTVNLAEGKVSGVTEGRVAFTQIAPVVRLLEADFVLPYVAAFTEIEEPIPVTFRFSGDLGTGDFDLAFENMTARNFRYQGVLLAKGRGSVRVSYRAMAENEAKYRVDVSVDPLETVDREGRRFGGELTVGNADGPVRLTYALDSELKFDDLLSVIAFFDREDFAGLDFDVPPQLTVSGRCGVSDEDLDGNDVKGALRVRHGSVVGMQVNDMTADFTLRRDVVTVSAKATGKTGGAMEWTCTAYLEGFERDKSHFSLQAKYRDGSLGEVADLLTFDLGERHGKVDADIKLSGMFGTNLVRTLNGKGTVKVSQGHLAQMKLFAALTEVLAETVPGVSSLVNQSEASTDFVIDNGVFKSDSVYVEGGLVSIKGKGTYDMVRDDLDFVVAVRLFKEGSVVGQVVHTVLTPVTKALLEFRLTGPIDKPQWKRITLLDRIF